MRHGSLFSGIGGFDLAAEWMGWENVFHCEWMPFPRKVLKYYWPDSISYENICTTDFTTHRGQIDILTGGFPCQPYSMAGKRLGKEDERHLWPEMLRAIREIEPTYIVGENVRGLTNWNGGVVFEEVCTDLESCGYEVQPILLPAASVNAPHRRDRIWFVAYCNKSSAKYKISTRRNLFTSQSDNGTSSDSNDNGQHECDCQHEKYSSEGRLNALGNIEQMGKYASDTKSKRTRKFSSENQGWQNRRFDNNGTIQYASDTSHQGLQRSKNIRSIGGIGQESNKQPSGRICTNWENFPTQSPICGGDDGLPAKLDGITFSKWRQESIKGYGNAIVPQVAFQIFKVIEQLKQRQ